MTLISGKLSTDGKGNFVDSEGRTVQLKGINLDGGAKFPKEPFFPSHRPISGEDGLFYDGDHVSFVGRPFPLHEAAGHFRRVKSLGYNTIRYIFTWEAIEHEGPGKYDEDFIEYTAEILKIANKVGGLYVYLDPHQDVWSRFSGGDGAPMWTLYAAGFDPRNFHKTEAALLENNFPHDPKLYPKMLWTTNYKRLVAGTMFALFFSGSTFAPKAIINGVNIQDYLQGHFIRSVTHFVQRLHELVPELFEEMIIGVETMNEPNSGYTGTPLITEISKDQNLRLGTCPTIFQSLKLGMGIPTEIDEYIISVTGPKKTGTKFVDPEDTIAWLETDYYDELYGFKRGSEWKLGECIWAQHGVWDIETASPLILDYFSKDPETGDTVDEESFINSFFVDFYSAFRNSIRKVLPDFLIFLQPPPLQIPPNLKGSSLVDNNTVFCPHYYDGMSLMFKTWNRKYNVDTLGIMRGRYINPVFGIVFGEGSIRRSFRKQLHEMKLECQEYLGENIPVIFSEIGMPFDMDDKKAFDDDDFSSQTSALDALGFALEGSNLSHSWWCYTADNCHKWGDRFNCEDFSFWSRDDDFESGSYSSASSSTALIKPSVLERTFTVSESDSATLGDSESSKAGSAGSSSKKAAFKDKEYLSSYNGLRAIDSTIRPYSIAINGNFIEAEFDLKTVTYTLKIKGREAGSTPTKVYVPTWHFARDDVSIDVTSGSFNMDENLEILEWYHGKGEQTITIKSITAQEKESNISSYLLGFFRCC